LGGNQFAEKSLGEKTLPRGNGIIHAGKKKIDWGQKVVHTGLVEGEKKGGGECLKKCREKETEDSFFGWRGKQLDRFHAFFAWGGETGRNRLLFLGGKGAGLSCSRKKGNFIGTC